MQEFHTVNTAESAMDGWLYDVLDRAGVHRISLDFAQPLVSSKGVDWNCEVCDVRNFARYAFLSTCHQLVLPGSGDLCAMVPTSWYCFSADVRLVSSAVLRGTRLTGKPQAPKGSVSDTFRIDSRATLDANANDVLSPPVMKYTAHTIHIISTCIQYVALSI